MMQYIKKYIFVLNYEDVCMIVWMQCYCTSAAKCLLLNYHTKPVSCNCKQFYWAEFLKCNERWLGSEPWHCLFVWWLWVGDSLFLPSCLTALSSLVYCHHLLSSIMNCSVHIQATSLSWLTGKASALCPWPSRRVRHDQLHHDVVSSSVHLKWLLVHLMWSV